MTNILQTPHPQLLGNVYQQRSYCTTFSRIRCEIRLDHSKKRFPGEDKDQSPILEIDLLILQ